MKLMTKAIEKKFKKYPFGLKFERDIYSEGTVRELM